MKFRKTRAMVLTCSLVLTGCTLAPNEPYHDPTLADDYFAPGSSEFEFRFTIPLSSSDQAAVDTASNLMITYMADYLKRTTDEEFNTILRENSVTLIDVEEDPNSGGSVVTMSLQMAGPSDLPKRLAPPTRGEGHFESERFSFGLVIPENAFETEHLPENFILLYSDLGFVPSQYPHPLQTISVEGLRVETPPDSYPYYEEFARDGVLDITVFFGFDHYDARYDLQRAEELFQKLRLSFDMPVSDFHDLGADSPPAVQRIRVGGRDTEVQIRIFHEQMFVDQRDKQLTTFGAEFEARDVFVYYGHSGPTSPGFLLARDEKPGDEKSTPIRFPLDELALLSLDRNRQQAFWALGCYTYSQYADKLYANPNQSNFNRDIVTTVNLHYFRLADKSPNPALLVALQWFLDTDD